MKGIIRFGKKEKLSARYIEPFEILKEVGSVVYGLALHPSMFRIHLVFHLSMLKKHHGNGNYIIC